MSSFFTDDTSTGDLPGLAGDASVPGTATPVAGTGSAEPAVNLVVIDPDDVSRQRLMGMLGSDVFRRLSPTTRRVERQ